MVRGRRWFRHAMAPRLGAMPPGQFAAARRRVAFDSEPHIIPPGSRLLGAAAGAPHGRRILFINQYYWPDQASTAQHLADLAESLAERGYECHVLTSQSRYQPGEPRPPVRDVRAGVHIHRVPATSLGRRGTLARMTDYLSFYAGACARALFMPRFDVVVTLTTPPIIGLIGVFLKRLKRTRHVYWSMDLHPDASLALGRMSPRKIFPRVMMRLSRFVYNQADRIVALGPYMADQIELKSVPAERIAIIPVWSRREEIFPTPRAANPLRKKLGIGESFIAMYSGNLGLAHSFDEIIEAARRLRGRTDVVFLFVGGGPRLGEVEAARERDGLSNIQLLDYFPRAQLHASLALADVHLVSMRPEMTGIVVPGKLYGVMAAGRPAIFVGPEHCESADTIRAAGCGFCVTPGDVDGICRAITILAANRSLSRRMGERGHSAFIASYERRLCCNEWHALVDQLLGEPAPPSRRPATPQRSVPNVIQSVPRTTSAAR